MYQPTVFMPHFYHGSNSSRLFLSQSLTSLARDNIKHLFCRGCIIKRLFHCSSTLKKTYYEILNVTPNAEKSDIKKAYYELSLKYHPDQMKGENNARLFIELTEAYGTLIDTSKRKQYDDKIRSYNRWNENDFQTGNVRSNYRNDGFYEQKQRPRPTGRTEHYNYDEWARQHNLNKNIYGQYWRVYYERHGRNYYGNENIYRDFKPENDQDEWIKEQFNEFRKQQSASEDWKRRQSGSSTGSNYYRSGSQQREEPSKSHLDDWTKQQYKNAFSKAASERRARDSYNYKKSNKTSDPNEEMVEIFSFFAAAFIITSVIYFGLIASGIAPPR